MICPRIAYMPQGLRKIFTQRFPFSRTSIFSAGCLVNHKRNAQGRIEELLVSTGLAPFAGRPAGRLSGGMKQKLGLCLLAHSRSRSAHSR